MRIEEVQDRRQIRAFLDMSTRLYRGMPWVRPLDVDIENEFSPEKNNFFERGEAQRWILWEGKRVIGRISAFYDKKTAQAATNLQPTGGIGFFECENRAEAAQLLLDTAKDWLSKKGMQAMDGPIHFGERDKWWGLLIEGFDQPPNYQCYYHPPYYRNLFEGYGFREYFRQYTYRVPYNHAVPEDMQRRASRILGNPKYQLKCHKKTNIPHMAEAILEVYNAAWGHRKDISLVRREDVLSGLQQVRSLMDENLLWFAYYEGQPIGFYLSLPDINQLIAPLGGKMHLWNKLRFMYRLHRGVCKKAVGLIFGVVPRFQGLGVPDALIVALARAHQGKYQPYDAYEMNWIGDFNPNMRRVVEVLGARVIKTHCTYRKLFDEQQPYRTLIEAMAATQDSRMC